jgi:hypothetical protein
MDNQMHSPLFGSFDDTGAIKGPGSYGPMGLPTHIVKGPDFHGALSTVIQIPPAWW